MYLKLKIIYFELHKMFSLFFQKFVCTTIRPTQLPFKELYNWDGAAEFVADYLDFEPLRPSYDLVSLNAHS